MSATRPIFIMGAADPRSWTASDKPIPPRGGVGLATVPRDRFGDLRVRDYGEGASEFVTNDITVNPEADIRFSALFVQAAPK